MCGITGVFNYNSNDIIDNEDLRLATHSMEARGPDNFGFWHSEEDNISFGHRRLSIIDLSVNANQPFLDEDGFSIVFNGEIYNYDELRTDLINKGVHFKSKSDTEVILKLYKLRGLDFINQIKGMFSFAIWDNRVKTLLIFRDHFGIKPLYYFDNGKKLIFSSQVKSILKYKEVDKAISNMGYSSFFLWGSISEPNTIYKNINSLDAGSFIISKKNQMIIKKKYFTLSSLFKNQTISKINKNDSLNFLKNSLKSSIKKHMVSDVPICTYLSSGHDSAVITNLLKYNLKKNNTLQSLTIGFDEFKNKFNDEVPVAIKLSNILKIEHKHQYIDYNYFLKFYDELINSMDQPTIDGVNSFFINLFAKENGFKVAISGIGADELFGGYSDFREIPKILKYSKLLKNNKYIDNFFKFLVSKFYNKSNKEKLINMSKFSSGLSSAFFFKRCLFLPHEIYKFTDSKIINHGLEEIIDNFYTQSNDVSYMDEYERIIYLHMNNYLKNQLLRDADWSSMAHSVEMRVPYVDLDFIKSVIILIKSKLPPTKKSLLNLTSKNIFNELKKRKKTGFSIPINIWLQKKMGKVNENSHPTKLWAKEVIKEFI